ncbi:MAG: hypothetical protein JRN15_10410, partial [Nitrososphaerota archaeon]|nr:hypothetical protein [Nitrososphaerota archaeon]
ALKDNVSQLIEMRRGKMTMVDKPALEFCKPSMEWIGFCQVMQNGHNIVVAFYKGLRIGFLNSYELALGVDVNNTIQFPCNRSRHTSSATVYRRGY